MPDAPDLSAAPGLGDFLTEEPKLEKTIYLCDAGMTLNLSSRVWWKHRTQWFSALAELGHCKGSS